MTSDAIPVVHTARKVPYLLKDELKKEFDRMKKDDIIDKADEPTHWSNSTAIVEKRGGKSRIYPDLDD